MIRSVIVLPFAKEGSFYIETRYFVNLGLCRNVIILLAKVSRADSHEFE